MFNTSAHIDLFCLNKKQGFNVFSKENTFCVFCLLYLMFGPSELCDLIVIMVPRSYLSFNILGFVYQHKQHFKAPAKSKGNTRY